MLRGVGDQQRPFRQMVMRQTSLDGLSYSGAWLDGRMVPIALEFDEARRTARGKGLIVRDALEQACAAGRRLLR